MRLIAALTLLLAVCTPYSASESSTRCSPVRGRTLNSVSLVRSRKGDYLRTLTSIRGGEAKRVRASATAQEGNDGAVHTDTSQDVQDLDLPIVRAVLIPRPVSIPRLIRLVSALILTSSLCGCLHTSGTPYRNAVRAMLRNDEATSAKVLSHPLTPLDFFLAKKIAQARNEILPPKHMPSALPLLGCMCAMLLNFGLTVLLPSWIVLFDALMNYRVIDVAYPTNKGLERIASFLQIESKEDWDDFYRSSLSMRIYGEDGQRNTGLAVLVQLPKAETDASRDKKTHAIYCLYRSEEVQNDGQHHPHPYYFEHAQRRIYFNPLFEAGTSDVSLATIDGGPTLHTGPMSTIFAVAKSGLSDESILEGAQARYSKYNIMALPTPTVKMAFFSRLTKPLAVLQLTGKLLTILEESILSSSLGLLTTLANHYLAAKKSIISATELAQEVQENAEEVDETKVWAIRPKVGSEKKKKMIKRTRSKWVEVASSELLPGDVFLLPPSTTGGSMENTLDRHKRKKRKQSFTMPVDALLLEGNCITDEAVLTGESVPQAKMPLDDADNASSQLDMNGFHRSSILFAGTQVMGCDNSDNAKENASSSSSNAVQAPSSSVKCLALRTGSYSSRGEMMRALSKSANHFGAISNADSEKDALVLIATLSCFALLSCLSLFIPTGGKHRQTSTFRRIIQCTRIAVASIPSDIPLALSAIANSCSMNLRKEADVVCSQPGSLLTSSRVDVMVFDKTGTLTAETQSLKYVVPPPHEKDGRDKDSKGRSYEVRGESKNQHPMLEAVLAGCHSLSSLEEDDSSDTDGVIAHRPKLHLVGDPVDIACLEYTKWRFDGGNLRSATRAQGRGEDDLPTPLKLWQIKTFPFDANRRSSSAIILVLLSSGEFRLLKVIKGSHDRMRPRLLRNDTFDDWYDGTNHDLGLQGTRVIVVGVQDLSHDHRLVASLFPDGLLNDVPIRNGTNIDEETLELIRGARGAAREVIHRRNVEDEATQMEFVGFACFDASVRQSTNRVITELQESGIKTCMLTGDGIDAAIAVARQSGIISCEGTKRNARRRGRHKVAILDVENRKGSPELVWRYTSQTQNNFRRSNFSLKTSKQIFERARRSECSIAALGDALDLLLSRCDDKGRRKDRKACRYLRNRLSDVAVIARASPGTKQRVVSSMKRKHRVLMCGDGVNDVAAMKTADVSVALLNGYGSEGNSDGSDHENERRLQKVKLKQIGHNRRLNASLCRSSSMADNGDSSAIARRRVKAKIDAALTEFKQSVLHGEPRSEGKPASPLKVLTASITKAIREERARTKALKKGGGEAARILAKEEALRKSVLQKGKSTDVGIADSFLVDKESEPEVKPGEACLAAAFTFLRPCIDGSDAIIRAGVAAAACSLSIHRVIALHSLMSCYNLATLYKDGFRYGKNMWNVEYFFLAAIDQTSYEASCSLRPRIAKVRPDSTIFTRPGTTSILAQAAIHLSTLAAGAKMANALELSSLSKKKPGIRIRWNGDGASTTFGNIITSAVHSSSENENSEGRILGRPKFRPNCVTNAVFLLSIFQNTVISLINYKGKPFYLSILESRSLCLSIAAPLIFCIVCISERFPQMNSLLQLAPLPSRTARIRFLLLMVIDLIACLAVERLSVYFLNHDLWTERKKELPSAAVVLVPGNAADEEERLLDEESRENKSLVFAMGMLSLALIANLLVSQA